MDFWTSYWKTLSAIASAPADQRGKPAPAATNLSPKEKYEYLSEYGTQILCMLVPGVGCNYLSKNFESVTGHSVGACLGEQFYNILHNDCNERLREMLESRAPVEKPQPFRCRIRHADGSWQWYLFLIHPQNERDEYVCIVENINEHIQTQNTLQKAKLEAELALRARSEFLANMSHDLRTPLNAVIGFSQIIESEIFGKIGNPQYVEYVKHIQESGYDLLSRIEDLLEISNIDMGQITLKKSQVSLSTILNHVIGAQMHHAAPRKITMDYRPLQGDAMLNVDRLKLQHIIGHLIANGIKFSHNGGRIIIETALTDKSELLIRIRDDGVGIAREKLAKISTALKEDNGWIAKSNSSGIGLGLALTKEFIALHGGSIKLISKEGVGTSVYITLPRECLEIAVEQEPNALIAAL